MEALRYDRTAAVVEYYFSFISLWSYIGSLVFQDLVRRHDVRVEFKPIDLIAVFAAGGGKPVRERPPQRQIYRLVEMERRKRIRDIPLVTWPKFYPADPSLGHRMLLAAIMEGRDVTAFAHAGLKAVWADELNVEDADTLVNLANASRLDGKRLLAHATEPELVAREASLTREGDRTAIVRRAVLFLSRRAVLGPAPARPVGINDYLWKFANPSNAHSVVGWSDPDC